MQVQRDGRVVVGRAFKHRAHQARLERGEELQRAQGSFAAHLQRGGSGIALEQPLVLAQRVLDLAVAGQRRIVVDAQPFGGLQLGLVVVADAADGHQPCGLVREPIATLAGACLRVCMRVGAGLLHWRTSARGLSRLYSQKMSNASSSLAASALYWVVTCIRSRSSVLTHSRIPVMPSGSSRPSWPTDTRTMPSGGSNSVTSRSSSAIRM